MVSAPRRIARSRAPSTAVVTFRTTPSVELTDLKIRPNATPNDPIALITDKNGTAAFDIPHGGFKVELEHARYKAYENTFETGDDPERRCEGLAALMPDSPNRPYDMKKVIRDKECALQGDINPVLEFFNIATPVQIVLDPGRLDMGLLWGLVIVAPIVLVGLSLLIWMLKPGWNIIVSLIVGFLLLNLLVVGLLIGWLAMLILSTSFLIVASHLTGWVQTVGF